MDSDHFGIWFPLIYQILSFSVSFPLITLPSSDQFSAVLLPYLITCCLRLWSLPSPLPISFPLRIKLFSTLDRAVKVIIAVWFCAFLAASPVLSIVVVNKLPVPDWALGQPWLPLVRKGFENLIIFSNLRCLKMARPWWAPTHAPWTSNDPW